MIAYLIDVVIYLVVLDAILSWFMGDRSFPRSLTSTMLAPIYRPIRNLFGGKGGIDFSPIILIVALSLLQGLFR